MCSIASDVYLNNIKYFYCILFVAFKFDLFEHANEEM